MHTHSTPETRPVTDLPWKTLLVAGFAGVILYTIAILLALAIFVPGALAARPHPLPAPPPPVRASTIKAYGGRAQPCATVKACRKAIAWQKHDRAKMRHQLSVRWHPSVVAAVRLASNISGVSFARLWTISGCESTHDPLNVLGQYEGLFQLGRYHRSFPDLRGLSPFDPYANAMHAALFIAKHGESQWSCRSDGSVAY